MFVIDKDGTIAYDGAIDNAPLGKQEPGAGTVNYVDKALSELLAGQKVSLPNTPPYGCRSSTADSDAEHGVTRQSGGIKSAD